MLSPIKSYRSKFRRHLAEFEIEDAVKHHVGGAQSYYRIGAIERRVLELIGLPDGGFVVDVGCGGGRLTEALASKAKIKYLGTDVVPKLIKYCRKKYRQDWRFEVVKSCSIPTKDSSADCVAIFSVFTHLLHDDTFRYIEEAYRILKPGGVLVGSFLEYAMPIHAKIFEARSRQSPRADTLTVFNDRDGFRLYARLAGFEEPRFIGGDEPFVRFDGPVTLPDGEIIEGRRAFGQSLVILTKGVI